MSDLSPMPPPVQLSYSTVKTVRPRCVKVIGILGIIFGGWGIITGLSRLAAVSWMIFRNRGRIPSGNLFLLRALWNFTGGIWLLALGLASFELAAAIGALRLARWSRRGLVWFAILELALDLFLAGETPLRLYQSDQLLPGALIQIGIYLIAAIWPALVIYYMTRPHVQTAFGSTPRQPSDDVL